MTKSGMGVRKMESIEQRVRRVTKEEIAIVPYDRSWPGQFRAERALLLARLPRELILRVEHFGSTAVPGLAAKPIVDMLVEVTDVQAARERIAPILESQAYECFWRPVRGDEGPPWYPWFIKRDPLTRERTHHIHMLDGSFAEIRDWLLFRDYLIAHPETAIEYEALKRQLAAHYRHDRVRYTEAKTAFVAAVTERGRSRLQGGRPQAPEAVPGRRPRATSDDG